ncbi:GntR family transcriptional regulator [Martelella soudanensis]|uniref:GntR family transcriptional regulator n=1 Tax=unclassified Martelella TaxID=2629616 RepID=UPI0015DEEE5B|nr:MULTISPECIES: GntR family transcriptional regulator [unclassified Martelella]
MISEARHDGSLPIYLQIVELIVRDLAAGRLVDGEKLAPERKLAAELDVAVGTLRKALTELETRGLLERRQGSGNYVRAIADPASVYTMFRLELIEGGGLPTARALSVDLLAKPDGLPDFGAAGMAYRIRRQRFVGKKFAALEEIWLDAAYAGTITMQDLSESLYLYYRTRLNLWITRAEDRVGLGTVPDWAPDAFGLSPGAPVPEVQRISTAQDGEKAEFSYTWFDPAMVRYVARLK